MTSNEDHTGLPAPPIEIAEAAPAPVHHGVGSRIRNYFLTGLILVGPIYITINLTWWFINWVDDLVRPVMPAAFRTETYLPIHVPGLGLIIAFITLTLLGFLTANLVGRRLVAFGENLLHRMPIVRPIYKTMKQIFETLFSKSGSSFRKVALVEFPAPGMWSLVFLSQAPGQDVAAHLPGTDHVSAFMPCTPNPTTGFFFYVPRKDIIELDITVESAMTLLMSAGMVQPNGNAEKKLAVIAETARAARAARQSQTAAPVT
jgi:uncharacterized membrane protein